MTRHSRHPPITRRAAVRVAVFAACALALIGAGQASGQSGQPAGQTGQPGGAPVAGAPAATLEACVTALTQAERSATFSGEMTAIAGTVRMAIRIDVEERLPGEALYRPVSPSGLGVWRASDPKVKVYKYLRQVTNLSEPASYRALVRFRWLGAKGHLLKRAERLTPRCLQPAAPAQPTPASPEAPAASSSAPALTA